MDGTKLRALGWHNQVGFEEGIARTVDWFRDNEAWWRAIRSGEWDTYYERQYADRLAGGVAAERGKESAVAAVRRRSAGEATGRRGHGRCRGRDRGPGSRSTAGTRLMRVAVTGAGGRLGSAVIAALNEAPFTGPGGAIAWTTQRFRPRRARRRGRPDRPRPPRCRRPLRGVDRRGRAVPANRTSRFRATVSRPECSRRSAPRTASTSSWSRRTKSSTADEPTALATRRRTTRTRSIPTARASWPRSARPWRRSRTPPGPQLAIARTAWLFGPGKPDFPAKILAAADRAAAGGESVRAVADEWGSPTYTADVADAIVDLLGSGEIAGIHHLVNAATPRGRTGRGACSSVRAIDVEVEDVPASTWSRASTPPAWGVLAQTPLPSGEPMQRWQDALAHYAAASCCATRGDRDVTLDGVAWGYGPSSGSGTHGAPFGSSGAPADSRRSRPTRPARMTRASSRPTCRFRPRACSAASTITAASSTTGW